MKKKLTLFVAVLAMLLTASAPLVLAQQAPTSLPEEPAPPGVPGPPSERVSTDPAVSEPSPPSEPAPTTTPTAGPAVGCQELYQDPKTFCIVDENGDITRPDGTKAAVVVDPKKTVFMVNEDGTLTPIGEGASFMVDDAIPSSTDQLYPTQENDTAPDTAPISADLANPPEGNHNIPDSTAQDQPPDDKGNNPSVSDPDKKPTGGIQYDNADGAPKRKGA
jgi:hypothetical protein